MSLYEARLSFDDPFPTPMASPTKSAFEKRTSNITLSIVHGKCHANALRIAKTEKRASSVLMVSTPCSGMKLTT